MSDLGLKVMRPKQAKVESIFKTLSLATMLIDLVGLPLLVFIAHLNTNDLYFKNYFKDSAMNIMNLLYKVAE